MMASIDSEVCIGCTLCIQVCPDVFEMEQDKAVVRKTPVPYDLLQACKDAASQCPVNAITLKE